MKISLRSLLVTSVLGLFTSPALGVPPTLTVHGRLAVEDVRDTGQGAFRFARVNAAGDLTCWSDDGTGAEGSAPNEAVPFDVSDGFYRVVLGDETLPNMTPLPSEVFASDKVYLCVWLGDGEHGLQPLSRDQFFSSAG